MAGLSGILGGLGGAGGGLLGTLFGGSGGSLQAQEIVALMRKLKDPTFDMRSLSPPEQQLVGQLFPEVYSPVLPEGPALAQDSPEMRAAQVRSLGSLEAVRDQGMPLEDRLASQQLQDASLQAQRQGVSSNVQALQRRGRLGAGDEVQARLLGSQLGTQTASDMGLQLARMQGDRRLQAMTGAAGLAGQIRGQDVAGRQWNMDTVNRFNELLSGLGTEAARYGAGERARTSTYNLGERQRISDENARARYGVNLKNLERQNTLRGLSSNYERDRTGMLGGALQDLGNFREMRRLQKIQLGQSVGRGVGQGVGGLLGGY